MNNKKNKFTFEKLEDNYFLNEQSNPFKRIMPIIVIMLILGVVFIYINIQRKIIIHNVEVTTEEQASHLASDIAEMIDFAENSIKLSAVNICQTMNSNTLEDPQKIISPMVENTPFGAIEYITKDGMNIMNIGEPFDASDRVYYIEGIKGNTGIWNNYHPKTSKETLINFYTPIVYEGEISGVITGYIEANKTISSIIKSEIYAEETYGILLDENNMIICSTFDEEFIPDYSLDMFLEKYDISKEQVESAKVILGQELEGTVAYDSFDGDGRVCVKKIPETDWRLVLIMPASSMNAVLADSSKYAILTMFFVCLIVAMYLVSSFFINRKYQKQILAEKAMLEKENRINTEEKEKAFSQISRIRDIVASADMGIWRIELIDEKEPRMYVDDTMKKLLGLEGKDFSPEETYNKWFSNIFPEALDSVLNSVDRMKQGFFDENTYKWIHPDKGVRYVRCGGTSQEIEGGIELRGYHYDVDDVVRKEKNQQNKLRKVLDEKAEYYETLGSLGDIFYSMHVVDLTNDSVIEFNAQNEVKDIVNHKDGAALMMKQVMSAVSSDAYYELAMEFTDLSTLKTRMKNKRIITKELVGKHVGWYVASFIAMDRDEEGSPTKVIFSTRVIEEEKRQEEKLVRKTRTDELTGLYNRRAYEEDIYAQNDIPDEDNYIYISIDINGLKLVNDTKGHMAGDELIIGACHCMKKSLGSYGKIYRTGGDEFVAILWCDDEQVKSILADFDGRINTWSGDLVDRVSVSYGWVSKNEEKGASARRLALIADNRMNDAKSDFYRKQGVDRRGQQDAHKALCELYTKILRINLTDDTYQIVNMDETEQTKEKGFADKISEWLLSFGQTGQVHPDDLDEYNSKTNLQYMREYFSSNKTSLHIFYRRKYGDAYKQVMMEIIPSEDYSNDNQRLFLYVKDIDK